jgi:CubicO group peptidase (beta-lactamase class C family)
MNQRVCLLVTVWLCMAVACPILLGAEPRDLSALLRQTIEKHPDVPALWAAIVEGDRVTALGAAGLRKAGDRTPVTAGDLIHLGSCTKAMTATLIGQLIDQRKLTMGTTMKAIFPDLAAKMNPEMARVTVAQLLQHTSGLEPNPDWGAIDAAGGPVVEQRKRAVEQALSSPPKHRPGSMYEYSNLGYMTLGAIVERETGKPWEEVIRQKLFEPLGMKSAGFGPPGAIGRVDQPWGHVMRDGRPVPLQSDNPPALGPAGRVHCTISDWGKFVGLYLDLSDARHHLVSAPTLKALTTPGTPGDYDGGWIETTRDWAGGQTLTHAGSNTMWYCVVWAAPKKHFAVLVAANIAAPDTAKAEDDVASALIGMHNGK